jgi:hypothetical protein
VDLGISDIAVKGEIFGQEVVLEILGTMVEIVVQIIFSKTELKPVNQLVVFLGEICTNHSRNLVV